MTKIKICGLKNRPTIEAAVLAGATYLGFVFAKSPRQMMPDEVRRLTRDLPERIKTVGVFVSPQQNEIEKTADIAGLDLVQIHGKKTVCFNQYSHLLLDAPPAKLMGGNGRTFDWQLVDQNHLPKEKLWLAGGLTSDNVSEAIQYFAPKVVDVSSGVETMGEKDSIKIHAFCQAVKATDSQIELQK